MRVLRSWFSVVLVLLLCSACRTTPSKEPAPADYRQDQATRQTQRDSKPPENQSRQPLQSSRRAGQGVIDQPLAR